MIYNNLLLKQLIGIFKFLFQNIKNNNNNKNKKKIKIKKN